VLQGYQDQFQYILVDEYQDTNDVQNKLIMMLGAKHKNIFLVGDEDQSIYKFRGANYKNLRNFEKNFKDTKVILLEQNYRSTQNILSAANSIIKNNSTKHKKNLWTDNVDGELITYYRAATHGDESLYIANEIKTRISKGAKPEDFAILYRSNFMSRVIEEGLRIMDIPYVIYGGVSYFKRKEIKDLIGYLQIVVDHSSDWHFRRVINTPKRGIGPTTLERIANLASNNSISMFEVCENAKDYFSKNLATKLIGFTENIKELSVDLEDLELDDFLDLLLVKTGYKKYLETLGEEGLLRLDNVIEFKSVFESWSLPEYSSKQKLELILADITLQTDIEEKAESSVKLMTMHNSKGLEFDYVFVYAMEEGLFPSSRSFDNKEDLEEERRLAYVAITRAKTKAFITNASARTVYGQAVSNPPSRFIDEIDDMLIDFKGNRSKTSQPIFKLETRVTQNANDLYKITDKVTHKVFGVGTVIQLDNSTVSIAFKAPHGIKKIVSGHHSITKI